MQDLLEMVMQEQRSLRTEIHQLKGCQVQYFTFAVTGTAALFGLSSLRSEVDLRAIAFLAPLTIVLPCWWIFFDKATTITRIVGYYRFLEWLIIEFPDLNKYFIGYETALALYRTQEDSGVHTQNAYIEFRREHMRELSTRKRRGTRHKYWLINWFTFAALSFFCCSTAYKFSGPGVSWDRIVVWGGIILSSLSALQTFVTLRNVISGKYSYNENAVFWEFILKNRQADARL